MEPTTVDKWKSNNVATKTTKTRIPCSDDCCGVLPIDDSLLGCDNNKKRRKLDPRVAAVDETARPTTAAAIETTSQSQQSLQQSQQSLQQYHPLGSQIGIFDDVVSREVCQELISLHDAFYHKGYIEHLTICRFLDLPLESTGLLIRIRYKCWQLIEQYYKRELELFPEFTSIMGWHPHSYLKLHYDSNRDYLSDRHYSAVLYLNDPINDDGEIDDNGSGFVGGDLVFEFSTATNESNNNNETTTTTTEFTITPKRGRLVCFPSTSEFQHKVLPILKGCRYTITMWFTLNENAIESLQDSVSNKLSTLIESVTDDDDSTKEQEHMLQMLRKQQQESSFDSSVVPPQPWETPEETRTIVNKKLERVGLVWDYEKNHCRFSLRDNKNNNDSASSSIQQILQSLSQQDILHFMSYCNWKLENGVQFHDLLLKMEVKDDDNDGNDYDKSSSQESFQRIYDEYNRYRGKRLNGLLSAYTKRWKNDGMITNLTADDNELCIT